MTTFGDQLYQHSGAPVGLPYAHLKGPTGKVLFVAPFRTASATGNALTQASDTNPGTLEYPLKTVAAAYALCTSNAGNIIYLLGYSNTSADITDDWSATMTWSKNATHLIGLSGPLRVSQRARIGQTSTATGISPLLNVTGNNNVFANFQIFQGVADATSLVNVQVTGQRNVFDNVHIAGMGDATMVAAGAASLKLAGAAENVFQNCVIGLDTITADNSTNGELWCTSSATRNYFQDCLFQRFISSTGYVTVTIGTNGIDRWLHFKRCLFITEDANDTVTQTSVFSIPAMSQGYIVLEDCGFYTPGASGAGDWDSNNRGRLYNNRPAAAAAAVGGIFTKQ